MAELDQQVAGEGDSGGTVIGRTDCDNRGFSRRPGSPNGQGNDGSERNRYCDIGKPRHDRSALGWSTGRLDGQSTRHRFDRAEQRLLTGLAETATGQADRLVLPKTEWRLGVIEGNRH